jgi:hypothetical protein
VVLRHSLCGGACLGQESFEVSAGEMLSVPIRPCLIMSVFTSVNSRVLSIGTSAGTYTGCASRRMRVAP